MKKYQQLFKQIQEKFKTRLTLSESSFLVSMTSWTNLKWGRDTVRKQLSLLKVNQKDKSQGSRSSKTKQVKLHLQLTSYQELVQELGLRSKTNVVSLDKIIIDKNPHW